MTITLNVPNKQLFDKILWFLNRFKNDGLEIIIKQTKDETPTASKQKALPSGFLNPIQIDSYSSIASRDEIYER